MLSEKIYENRLIFGIAVVIVIWLIGAIFYYNVEHFSLLDSFYFAATTLTTVGFGDLHPATDAGKIFTVFYVFVGLGVVLYVLTLMGRYYVDREFRTRKRNYLEKRNQR